MQDRFGLVPDAIRADYQREEVANQQIERASALATALHAHDPQIQGVTFFDQRGEGLPGVKPGRWHVWRKNEGAPDTYYPIEKPDGSYREPDFGVLAEMQQRDLWRRPSLIPNITRRERMGHAYYDEDPDPAEARARQTAEEQRRDEVKSDFEAGRRVAGEGGMTKRKWGRGGK